MLLLPGPTGVGLIVKEAEFESELFSDFEILGVLVKGEFVELLFEVSEVAHMFHAGIDGELAAPRFVAEWVAFVNRGEVGATSGDIVLRPLGSQGENDAGLALWGIVFDFKPSATPLPVEGVVFGKVHVVLMATTHPDDPFSHRNAIDHLSADLLADILPRCQWGESGEEYSKEQEWQFLCINLYKMAVADNR